MKDFNLKEIGVLINRGFRFIFIVSFCLVSACLAIEEKQPASFIQPTVNPSQGILDYFPLKKNAYWVYQGTVKWTRPNSSDIVEEEITWKMEVERVFQRNDVIGYEMLGAPWDLAWYENGKQPSQYGIVQTGGKYYRVPVDNVIRLMNEEDNLFGLVNENSIFLDIPVIEGKKFCDSVSMARPDGMYCWNVGPAQPFDAKNITGVDPSQELWEYSIVNQSMPDVSLFYFVPGIGISQYFYRHFGTVSEVNIQLVEYYAGD